MIIHLNVEGTFYLTRFLTSLAYICLLHMSNKITSPVNTGSLCLLKESLRYCWRFFVYHLECWFLSRRGPVRSHPAAIKVCVCPRAKLCIFHMHVSESDGCVGPEWQGPVWVVNHSDSALGRRSGMVPVDEWPLNSGVRTEASLNNSMKRLRGRERR